MFTGPLPWDIFDTGFDYAEVDFFGLLQDGAMDAFDDDDVGHFPITMGTIGDLAEAGHYGVWEDVEDDEEEDDADYLDEEDEEEEEDDIDEEDEDEDEEEDIDEDLEEVDHILEKLWEEEEDTQPEQPQPHQGEGLDYDPAPDCYDMGIDDDDRVNLYDAEIYLGNYAMNDRF